MTVIFESKYDGKTFEYSHVKFFTTDAECFGTVGYDLHFENKEFCLLSRKSYNLVMVKNDAVAE